MKNISNKKLKLKKNMEWFKCKFGFFLNKVLLNHDIWERFDEESLRMVLITFWFSSDQFFNSIQWIIFKYLCKFDKISLAHFFSSSVLLVYFFYSSVLLVSLFWFYEICWTKLLRLLMASLMAQSIFFSWSPKFSGFYKSSLVTSISSLLLWYVCAFLYLLPPPLLMTLPLPLKRVFSIYWTLLVHYL